MVKRQERLLQALKYYSAAQTPFTAEDIAAATGYAVASIRAYFSKKLVRAGFVEVVSGRAGCYRATIPQNHDNGAFVRLLSQNDDDPAINTMEPADWMQRIVVLIADGARKGFSLTPAEFDQIARTLHTRVSRDG